MTPLLVILNQLVCICALRLSIKEFMPLPQHDDKELAMIHSAKLPVACNKTEPYLVFVRTHKTAGSTLGGIIRRVGEKKGYDHVHDIYMQERVKNNFQQGSCPAVLADHARRIHLDIALNKAGVTRTFFLTILRDPIARCMSYYYFRHVKAAPGAKQTWGNEAPNDEKKIQVLKACRSGNEQELFEGAAPAVQEVQQTERQSPDSILNAYDFVAVTERFDESLVLLCRRIQCKLSDILYVRAKDNTEAHVPFDQESTKVKEAAALYITGSPDATLYHLANERLDNLISEAGDSFRVDLTRFQKMLAVVTRRCSTWVQNKVDCMHDDNGCAQTCINDLVVQNGWL